jgi:hypothetical protein
MNEFAKEYLGEFVGPHCEIKSSDGKHECGGLATHFFMLSENPVMICERCLQNAKAGIYGKRLQMASQFAFTTDQPIPRKEHR